MSPGLAMASAMGLMSVSFLIAWAVARKWECYSIVDVVWAFGIGLTAIFWLVLCGDGSAKHWVAGVMVVAWSLRLGNHLQHRIGKSYPEEDPRYQKLKEHWSGWVAGAFFWLFQGQALSAVLLALPFLVIAADPDGAWSAWETVGLGVALAGITGESLADAQMSHFKKAKPDKKDVCREGLWRYSRHPNYFFESVIWAGFYLYACGSDWGWAMIHAPAIIVFLLLKVTGIPPTEASALKRKGNAYLEYQRTTSAFIPWPPK